jgi:hypothetical protein
MYDVNPLGPMMHLRELDRRAARRHQRLRPKKQNGYGLTAIREAAIAVLRRLHTFHMFGARRWAGF